MEAYQVGFMSVLPSPKNMRYVIILLMMAAWEVMPRVGMVPYLFLPPLSDTLIVLVQNLSEYSSHLWVTLKEAIAALLIACVGGVVAGMVIGSSSTGRRFVLPFISSAYAVPLVVLYPLFTAWFGIGSESKIIFASVYGIIPTMLGAAAGVQTLDRNLLMTARSMGAKRYQKLTRVIFPATLPTIMSSVRIGGALVIVGVVVAEMLMSTAGIGFLISRYRTMLDSPRVFAAILLVLVIALIFDFLIQCAEKRFSRWIGSGATKR